MELGGDLLGSGDGPGDAHGFKHEHYWMGVSMHAADNILGTNPDARDVEASPTCRDLMGQGKDRAA